MKLKAIPLTIFVTVQLLGHLALGQSVALPEGLLIKDQVYGESGELVLISSDFQKYMSGFVKSLLAMPLKQNQASQIAWVDIEQLIQEVDQVTVYANTSNKAVVGSNNRLGSVNFTEQKIALINTSLLQELTRPQGPLTSIASSVGSEAVILHEFLGALGYPDDNYEMSTYLYMRTFPQDYGSAVLQETERSLTKHLNRFPRRTKNAVSSTDGGTSTGVGGGGDPASAAMKLVALSTLAQQKSLLLRTIKDEVEYKQLIQFINSLRIEPSESPSYDSGFSSKRPVIVKDGKYLSVDTAIVFQVRTGQQVTAIGIAVIIEALSLMRASQ
ncbi:hypothetical protein [Bdellovibrio bacteriovorus]|uniref:hypothetical protein n=1 Tax=Bdellovibrio bacteriovorus TaxID=959 RepID=UPI003CFC30E9